MNNQRDIIVIGGGAAGMIAAWRGAVSGGNVLLLEKNKKPGVKILISGGGKCNITNGSSIQSMLQQFEKNESRFLKFPFHTFTNIDLLSLLREQGVETYTRDNGKVFPISHNADDVVLALVKMLEDAGVDIRMSAPVREITKNNEGKFIVSTDRDVFVSDSVIVATGGKSYQKTGTTGDGFQWLEQFGHTVVPLRPALAPIHLVPTPPTQWQGTPIRDCTLLAVCGQTTISEWHGDVLFTHFGISGPAALEISKKAFIEFEQGKLVTIHVDFFPEHSIESLNAMVMENITSNNNRNIATLVEQLVPQKLASYLLLLSDLDETIKLHQLKKEQRHTLVCMLKRCPVGTVKEIPLDRGEVTAGGIALHEVSPTTMESKLLSRLYLCGEILDIAGPVGGYNLQAAFSTGYVAGNSAGSNYGKH